MAYVKTTWEDRMVEHPNRYLDQNGNELVLTQSPGIITRAGTLVEAAKMNKIEDGIYNAHVDINTLQVNVNNQVSHRDTATLLTSGWVQNLETQLYEYTINDSNITADTFVDVVLDIPNQKLLGMASVVSSAGNFKIQVETAPSENIDITYVYKLTSEVV